MTTPFPPPSEIIESLNRWLNFSIEPGSFLSAVLRNDLMDACGRADDVNRLQLWNIVYYCANNLPAYCWGDEQSFKKWLNIDKEDREAIVKHFNETRGIDLLEQADHLRKKRQEEA